MKPVRYIGPEARHSGPWGAFAPGEVREVTEEHHAYVLANLPTWFEDASDSSASAAPDVPSRTKPAVSKKK